MDHEVNHESVSRHNPAVYHRRVVRRTAKPQSTVPRRDATPTATIASSEKDGRVPSVSACLQKGVLPRQHNQIKEVMSMLSQQRVFAGGPSPHQMKYINDKLMK